MTNQVLAEASTQRLLISTTAEAVPSTMADYPPVVAHEPELELPGVQRVKHSDPVPKLELPSVHRKEHGNPVLKLELPSVQTEDHGVPIPKLEVSSGELMLASKSHPELVMGLIDLPGGEKVGLGCLQPAARTPIVPPKNLPAMSRCH